MKTRARSKAVKVVDLFSGAGLFSAGMIEAGATLIEAVELDRLAAASYSKNIGARVTVGSVAETKASGTTDVLIAGPPCQGFSTLGRRDPSDQRNDLSLEIPRWASETNAQVVVVENVPPFLASTQWKTLAHSLEGLGFSIDAWELDAFDYGAPQRRRRAFTIASKVGVISAPLTTGPGRSVENALSDVDDFDAMHRWPEPTGIAKERIALVPLGGDKRDIIKLAPELCPPSWLRMGCQATDAWGRIKLGQPANTIRCTFQNPSKGRYLHPTANRTLSLREGARLQGVPDSWQFVGRGYPIARQIGNGVPIPLAAAVGKAVVEAF